MTPDRRPRPLDPEPEGGAPRPGRRTRAHAGDAWNVAKWVAVALGAMQLVLVMEVANGNDRFRLATGALFMAAIARLAQAEQHRYPL